MHQDRDVDRRINGLLSGLEKILTAIGQMRNESSDSHGVGDRRINLKEHHARLFVNAAMTMADFILSVEKTVKMHSKSNKESNKMTTVIYARYSNRWYIH